MREVLSGRGLREKTQTPFIPYRIPTGVPMRVGFGICQGRRLCRLRDGNGWRCLWAPGWARAHGQRGAKPLSKCVICQYNHLTVQYGAPSSWRSHVLHDMRLITLPPLPARFPPERDWAYSAILFCTPVGPSFLTEAKCRLVLLTSGQPAKYPLQNHRQLMYK